jgi:carbon starvation protein CstA
MSTSLRKLYLYTVKPFSEWLGLNKIVKNDAGLVFPFFPFQCIVGVSVAMFLMSRVTALRSYVACWIWILPGCWLTLLCTTSGWNRLFLSSRPSDKQVQFVSTLPFLTSVFYALGCWFVLRRLDARDQHVSSSA